MAAPRTATAPETETERLRAELARLTDQLARLTAEKEVLEAACHEDPVTGLLNRRGFFRDLARALSYARRYETPAALLLVDLDRFKPINDRWGHAAGDLALRHVAEVLAANLRASDSLGRIGGDEFAILLWQVDDVLARQKADVLEAALEAAAMPLGRTLIRLEASIGTTRLAAADDPAAAMARADAAMYARKSVRRGRSTSGDDVGGELIL